MIFTRLTCTLPRLLYKNRSVYFKYYTREQLKCRHLLDASDESEVKPLYVCRPNQGLSVERSSWKRHRQLNADELNNIYNQVDTNLTPLNLECCGCGSVLQCNVPGGPGFIPLGEYHALRERLQNYNTKRSGLHVSQVCVRCVLFRQHSASLELMIQPHDFLKYIIGEINQHQNAVIILIADMMNLPHSLIPDIHLHLKKHKYVLVGNKVDQLPIDGPNYLDRWRSTLLQSAVDRCKMPRTDIHHIALLSAMTGFGVSSLVEFLLSRRFHSKSPIFLVGSTNVGKSSLFNSLLLSDVCKSVAREAIHRATISTWPGTTTGFLRFPLTLMDGVKYAQRVNSRENCPVRKTVDTNSYGFRYVKPEPVNINLLDHHTSWQKKINSARDKLQDLTEVPTYSWTTKLNESHDHDSKGANSIQDSEYNFRQLCSHYLPGDFYLDKSTTCLDQGDRLLTSMLNSKHFHHEAFCFDTPGVLCPDQVLNFLSPNELLQLEDFRSLGSGDKGKLYGGVGKVLIPRTFTLKSGLSLLMGALGIVDVLSSSGPVYLTTFTHLPVHIVSTPKVFEYRRKFAHLLIPYEDPANLDSTTDRKENATNLRSVNDSELVFNADAMTMDTIRQPVGGLPEMIAKEIDPIETSSNLNESSLDVVLSGAGWVSVVGKQSRSEHVLDAENGVDEESRLSPSNKSADNPEWGEGNFILRAWTPGGLGIATRSPPLIPFAVKRRGRRIRTLREFAGL